MSTNWIAAFDGADTDFTDIRYERSTGADEGIAKITIDRPEVRNAFRPAHDRRDLARPRARPRGHQRSG